MTARRGTPEGDRLDVLVTPFDVEAARIAGELTDKARPAGCIDRARRDRVNLVRITG